MTLFPSPATIRAKLGLPDPREAGAVAAAACAAQADVKGWDSEGARACILDYLGRLGPTSGESLVSYARARGFAPHDDRAFGAVFAALVRRGLIRCVGYCPREKGHGTAGGRVWTVCGQVGHPL